MRNTYLQSDRRDRAKSVAATLAIHLALGTAFLTGLAIQSKRASDDSLKTFDVREPPPPPPVPAEPEKPAERRPAAEGIRADPSPIVAPPARIPTPQPIAAAVVPGSGSSSTARAGAGAIGTGTGAGGSGTGRGGNGGIGVEARLLSGNRSRLSRQLLRPLYADRGYAHLMLTVGGSGRVIGCATMQGTGSRAVDDALCQIMIGQSRWSPALDTAGRPITVQVRYTATWSKD